MGTSRFKQVGIYVGKHFRLFKNEKGWKMLIFAAVIALTVSCVLGGGVFKYDLDTTSGFFAIVSACIWIGIFNSIQAICKERAIIKREHRTGLHISAYVVSHLIYQGILCFLEAILMIGISAIFLRYPSYSLLGSAYIEFFITYFLLIFTADALGLAISSIVKTPSVAMTIMPFVLIIQLVFAGVIFSLSGPVKYVANATISKWGLNAACISADYNNLESAKKTQMKRELLKISRDNGLNIGSDDIDKIMDEYYEEEDVSEYGYSLGNLAKQWGILLAHCAVYSAISIVSLEFIDRDKR
ncbi:MAG: ABC transporter permease [Clostridia bacterium]|nr:ABC transporter permease [Oscillospiraceae bacterium]MBQ1955450.1 ABC transporter permease [Clostridia bacterium]